MLCSSVHAWLYTRFCKHFFKCSQCFHERSLNSDIMNVIIIAYSAMKYVLWKTLGIRAAKTSKGCLNIENVAVTIQLLSRRYLSFGTNCCQTIHVTIYIYKHLSKNLDKAQDQSGLISDWDLGCSVMTPQTLSLCT